MQRMILLLVLSTVVISGCVVVAPVKGKAVPPGQVQKATGYNPASGKVKIK